MTLLRAGIDIVQISHIAYSVACFGDRFVDRVFTPGEADYCRDQMPSQASHFAARFAAKEATIKVLRPTGQWIDWRSIEVVRHVHGWCDLRLKGPAARLAHEANLHDWSLSLTHEANFAAAVVIATGNEGGCRSSTTAAQPSLIGHKTILSISRIGSTAMYERILAILQDHGRLAVPLASLDDGSDLYRAGMTSHASVNVMLALEDEFDVEFPDRMLRREVFGSVSAIHAALQELTGTAPHAAAGDL